MQQDSTKQGESRAATPASRWRGLLASLLFGLLSTTTVQATPGNSAIEPGNANSKQVLSQASASIVQIQALYEGNTEKASHGSGFVVASDGLAITNYHVVSDMVLYPDKYQLRYRTETGMQGPVELVAFDVIHDLALVRLKGHESVELKMTAILPRRGERAYAVGYPLDVGLTLTQGISNGLVADSFTERLHYAGAINAGMSGGPTLDVNGTVIGINVAAYRSRQSVGFLVPARHALSLLSRGRQEPPGNFKAEITRQLHLHAQTLLAQIPAAFPQQSVGNITLPGKPSALFDCVASGNPAGDQPVRYQTRQCSAQAGIYIDSRLITGEVRFEHNIYESLALDPIRFSNYLEARTVTSARDSFDNWAPGKEFGPTACEQRVVRNQGIDLVASICARSYKRFSDLYDLSLTLVTSHDPLRGLTSKLSLTGVPFDPALAVIERYLKAISPAKDRT